MELSAAFLAKIDLRTRLRSLTFKETLGAFDSNNLELPVYTEEELRTQPIKWLKYILLDRTGVEPISRICSEIHRFDLCSIDLAQAWVAERIQAAETKGHQVLIVAKLVPWDQGAQLKNYRIHCINDIEIAFTQIRYDQANPVHELWCCESEIASSGLNLGGRLNFPKDRDKQILELVWFASPRLLEEVSLSGFDHPYLRADRSTVDPEFRVTALQVPEEFYKHSGCNLWREDFEEVLWLLSSRQFAMQRLVAMLHEFGANEVCFCFKVTDGHLSIIDWDTEIESTEISQ